jgi:L-fuconolactonase
MQSIDAHVHVWVNRPEYPWAAEEQDIPGSDARAEDLIELLKSHGVSRAVLVQYIKYRWDNRYVADILRSYPALFVGVCRVNPEDPSSPDKLSGWVENHGFQGVRLSPAPDASGDWFTGSLMLPLFQRAAALRIPVLILTKPSRLPDLAALLEKVPEAAVLIDHLADCHEPQGAGGGAASGLNELIRLARYPGVYLKIGHIPQNSREAYPWRDTHLFIEQVCQAYGTRRILWGSDWPLSLPLMTYAQSINFIRCELDFLSAEDREWILGKTALQIWPVNKMEDEP